MVVARAGLWQCTRPYGTSHCDRPGSTGASDDGGSSDVSPSVGTTTPPAMSYRCSAQFSAAAESLRDAVSGASNTEV